jgi:hypothetical protein
MTSSILSPAALLPALRAEVFDDESALEGLHAELLREYEAADVARAWAAVFVAACAETKTWGPELAEEAVTTRSLMMGASVASLAAHGCQDPSESIAVFVIATAENAEDWVDAIRSYGRSDLDAAWGLSRAATAAVCAIAVLLEGPKSRTWPGADDADVAIGDERAAARSDALRRIARRLGDG